MSDRTGVGSHKKQVVKTRWEDAPTYRIGRILGWITLFPVYVFIALRHHSNFSTAAIFGNPGTYVGSEHDVYTFGGLQDDGQTHVDMSYPNLAVQPPDFTNFPNAELDAEDEYLISRLRRSAKSSQEW